jgi:alpha-1,3-mannosyltransferase
MLINKRLVQEIDNVKSAVIKFCRLLNKFLVVCMIKSNTLQGKASNKLFLFFIQLMISMIIIWKVNYTEIDYKTYMQQVQMFLYGERDYKEIKGDSGPLVYPAGFLYIYSLIYYICKNSILRGQLLFAGVQALSVALMAALYDGSDKPSWIIFLLLLSKRIQSIYTLRMFNDTIAMLLLYTSLLALKKKIYLVSGILFSFAISVKMNILLYAPGYGVVLIGLVGFVSSIKLFIVIGMVQVLIGLPFILHNYSSYLSRAFEFNRVFNYTWTVNWKFINQKDFYSDGFSKGLLILHLSTLFYFVSMKWGFSLKKRSWNEILCIIFTSNFIGIVFSRSLHYQFYSWYFYSIPFLLWSFHMNTVFRIILMIVIEICWNTYPANVISSLGLFVSHLLILAGLISNKIK